MVIVAYFLDLILRYGLSEDIGLYIGFREEQIRLPNIDIPEFICDLCQ